MALITEKPDGLPGPVNDLDKLPDDPRTPRPGRLKLGTTTLLAMDALPAPGEFIKIEVTLRCRGGDFDLLDDGNLVFARKAKLVSAKVTTEPYTPEPDPEPEPETPPPGLFNSDGSPSAEASGEPQTVGEIIGNLADDEGDDEDQGDDEDDGLDEFRPQFSDGD